MAWLGLDMGGTSVRCIALHADGSFGALTRAAGGNFRSSGAGVADRARRVVIDALAQAAISPESVAAVTVGAAGAGEAGHAEVEAIVNEALAPLGLPRPDVRDDLEIAFRSASPTEDGVLLLAGTGAVAARYRGWRRVARCDGMGWLLGDVGSGLWLGREVLRAAAADLDGRGAHTALTGLTLRSLGLEAQGDQRQPLIRAAAPLSPAEWGRFAPLALDLDGNDDVATALLDRAAAALTTAARAVGADRRIVFAGGLLAGGGLRSRLDRSFEGRHAPFPALGACALAAESTGATLDLPTLTRVCAAEAARQQAVTAGPQV